MRTKKVLIVDDDRDWREFLKLCLEELGYEPHEASNGSEALEKIEREDFFVVLLDLNMPGIPGEEVAERIGANGPRVVLLTQAAMEQAGAALRGNATYYLPKAASQDALSLLLSSLH